jgi:hypothetical protein
VGGAVCQPQPRRHLPDVLRGWLTYIIVSGGGPLVTGGRLVNGRKSTPESAVTKVLNGPSCSGATDPDRVLAAGYLNPLIKK